MQRGSRELEENAPGGGLGSFPVALAEWLPAVFCGLLPVVWLPAAVDLFILPRAALVVGFGVLLPVAAAAVGGPGWGRLRPLRWPLLAAAGAALVAAAFSINPWLSLGGAYTRYESLLVRLAYLGIFVGAAALGRRERARAWVLRAFVAGCCVAALEAVWQAASVSFRPDGNLGQPGLLGALLAMALPLALHLGLRSWPWLVTVAPLGLGLYFSLSRAGWLGALAGCTVIIALALPARRRRQTAWLAAAAMVVAVTVLLVSPLRHLNQDTGTARLGVWSDAVRMAAARPLTGWGEDATGLVFGRFQTRDWEPGNTFDRIHDQPLDLLVAQGLAGGLAALWLWGAFWVRVGRAGWLGVRDLAGPAGACLAYAAWSLLNFDWAPATGAFYALAGVAWAAAQAEATPAVGGPSPGSAGRPAGGWASAAAAGLAVVVALALTVPPLFADVAYRSGRAAQAVALDPLQARYHQALGEQLGPNGRGGLAELRRARDLGDYDYSFLIELGDAERTAGHPAEARRAYRAARDTYPFDPTAPQRLAALGG